MFDCTLNSSWDERTRFGLTTLTSLGLQILAVGVLLLLPLLRPMGLPLLRQLSTPVSLGQPLPERQVASIHEGAIVTPINPADITFRSPSRIPRGVASSSDEAPPIGASGPSIFATGGTGDSHGIPNLFANDSHAVLPAAPPKPPATRLRISHISEGNLIRKVQPAYPSLARTARIQGQVVLQAVIGKQGSIENLKVLSGHPMLVPAAIEAVKQWRYRPYVLNNEPVEVETQITVNFSLAGN